MVALARLLLRLSSSAPAQPDTGVSARLLAMAPKQPFWKYSLMQLSPKTLKRDLEHAKKDERESRVKRERDCSKSSWTASNRLRL